MLAAKRLNDRANSMNLKAPGHMLVVKKEDKETKVRQLLVAALNGMPTRARGVGAPLLRLLAQTPASPVVKAVVALQHELAAAGVEARIIYAKAEQGCMSGFDQASTCRHLSDVRCHDAHELMVLTAATTWIGDCMRRDPVTRDSFEMHTQGCAKTAGWAIASFDKLWAHSSPVVRRVPQAVCPELNLVAGLAGLPGDVSAPQVLTRH
jgi:hypothetical protein